MVLIPEDISPDWTFDTTTTGGGAGACCDNSRTSESSGAHTDMNARRIAAAHDIETSPLNKAILSIVFQGEAAAGASSQHQAPSESEQGRLVWSLDPALLAELSDAYFIVANAYVGHLTARVAALRLKQRLA